jgi:hypothetical protein
MKKSSALVGLSLIIQIVLLLTYTPAMANGNSCGTATRISVNTYIEYLQINPPGDLDYFYFTLPAAGKVTITGNMQFGNLLEGYLMNSTCTSTIASNYLSSLQTHYINVPLLAAGTYRLRIEGNYYSTVGNYWIKVAYQKRAPEIAVQGNDLYISEGDTSPSSTDGTEFGMITVGGSSVVHTFTIANSGSTALNLTGTPYVNISGPHASDFSISQQPNSPVAINGTTTFQVTFHPSSDDLREATISIPNNDSNENPYNFAIAGTGVPPAPEIMIRGNDQEIVDGDTTPESANGTEFGMAVVGDNTITHIFTIANNGTAALNLSGTPYVSISGLHAGDFSVNIQPGSQLEVDETTSFEVCFNPNAEGLREAIVSIANDDGDENPYEFGISGLGVLTAIPEITISGNGIEIIDGDTIPNSEDGTDFGPAGIVAGVVTQTFTITNDGIAALNLMGAPQVSINGAQANDFSITVQPSTPVAAGDMTTFQVCFTPKAEGMREASLSIANDDRDENPYDLSIRGVGLKINSVISGLGNHNLALQGGAGDLWAWGNNNNGQLGNGETTNQSAPILIGSHYSAITVGPGHSLALKSDGSLYAWGDNSDGRLGDGTTTDRTVPTLIGTDYIAIAAGGSHSLAMKNDGSLWACGDNLLGQLGDGTTTDRAVPSLIGTGYRAIAAGGSHSLALKSDGSLWAWGDGTAVPTLIGNDYIAIAAGTLHSLALKNDGSLWAWGWNSFGQLGDGTTTDRSVPTLIGNGYCVIAAGWRYSLALKNDGSLWAWGDNFYGQLGDGTATRRLVPTFIGPGYSSIAGGYCHSLALKGDGSLWAWGKNVDGQLGDGTTTDRLVPTQIFSEGFIFLTHDMLVAAIGDGTGSVISEPQGIDCGTECRATFNAGTEIFLTPVAETGSIFTSWNGACVGSEIPCKVDLDKTKYVTANFSPSDEDGDGLNDSIENAYCTDPFDFDSDDDGISDGMEDTNHNGVVDSGETSPCLADSDGDGIHDGTELGYILADISPDTDTKIFIADADPSTTTDPTDQDSDGDGYTDGQEDLNVNGRIDFGEADPFDESDIPHTGPVPTDKLLPSDAVNNQCFGHSVAVSGDVILVGAYRDNDNGYASGSAYVFRWNGSNWVEEQKLLPGDGASSNYFGCSVAVNGDVALIGAYASDAAYVFRWNGNNWVEEQKLVPSDSDLYCRFGHSVAVSGDWALVGVYEGEGNGNDSGSAYMFRWNGSSWVEEQKLIPSDGAPYCRFGYSVVISGDLALIGAYNDKANGYASGSAYIFRWNGSSWAEEQKLLASDGASYNYFGYSVAARGDLALVGAYNGSRSGSAYMFRWNGSSWIEEQKLLASDGAEEDHFGSAVAINGDMALIGAYGDDDDNVIESGSSYMFHWNGNSWVEEHKIRPFDGSDRDHFGWSLSLDGHWALVGSSYDNDNGISSGSVYIHLLSSLFSDQDGDGLFDFLEAESCTDQLDADSDDDGLSDGTEDINRNGVMDFGETDPCNIDTDNDNMPDGWEVDNGLDPLKDDAYDDKDMDGFNNIREYFAGTNADDINDKPNFEPETEGFESGDFTQLPWLTTGDAFWTITTTNAHGVYSAQAASIPDNQSTSFEINRYTEAGDMRFWYAVDSEAKYDFLNFYIDGTLAEGWSGSVPFNQVFFSVTEGMHHFKWEYVKDKADNGGADTAWIDDISFPGFVDSDFDGMPDGWEIEHDLDPLTKDNHDDADDDLFTNHMECLMGTDPQNQADCPNVEKGFDGDLDLDGLDVSKFANGLSAGTLTGSELLDFSKNFGK